MNNQEFKIRSKIIGTNSNEPLFHLYSIEVNKCSCSCSNTNYPYSKSKSINVRVFNIMSKQKQGILNDIKLRLDNVDQIQVFVTISNVGIKINVDANVKNLLIMEDVIKHLFGILVIVNVILINYVMFESIQITKIVNAEKNQTINQSKSVVKILMEMR